MTEGGGGASTYLGETLGVSESICSGGPEETSVEVDDVDVLFKRGQLEELKEARVDTYEVGRRRLDDVDTTHVDKWDVDQNPAQGVDEL